MTSFKTSDIILAAYLKCLHLPLTKIEIDGRKGTFIFEDVSTDIVDEFFLGHAQVEPITFNNEIKTLTTAVRSREIS